MNPGEKYSHPLAEFLCSQVYFNSKKGLARPTKIFKNVKLFFGCNNKYANK